MRCAICIVACTLILLLCTDADDTIDCSIRSINLQRTPAQVAFAINDAIIRCAANATHRGVVTLPTGTYHTGSLIVRSNIELHVPAGTHLKASLKARLGNGVMCGVMCNEDMLASNGASVLLMHAEGQLRMGPRRHGAGAAAELHQVQPRRRWHPGWPGPPLGGCGMADAQAHQVSKRQRLLHFRCINPGMMVMF